MIGRLSWGRFFLGINRGVVVPGAIATVADDAKYNAWPSMRRLGNGNVLLAYTKADTHHLDVTGKAVGRISSDDGATFGSEFTIYDDPSLWVSLTGLVVLDSGRIVASLFMDNYAGTGLNPLDGAFVTYSDDQGATWAAPVTVNSSLSSYSYGSGGSLDLGSGVVLQCVEGKNSGDTFSRMVVLKSTDYGATWGSQVTIATGTRNYYEACLLKLDTGELVVLLRTSDASGDIYISRSSDSGATWSSPTLAFAGHGQPNLIQLAAGTLVAVTRENLGTGTGGVWVYTSRDRGATWSSASLVDGTMYEMEYGHPLEKRDHSVLVAYGYQPSSALTNADIKTIVLAA